MGNDFEAALEIFQKNPGLYYREVLGVTTLEEYQDRCLQTIADNDRTAIKACHDLGKTFIVARLVPWFLGCFPYSKVITTAPTYNQVKNILWSEIRTANARSKFPIGGEVNLTEWKIDDGWFAIGFTPRNEVTFGEGQGTQSSFQGFHAEGGVLVIFDEATGIPPAIWTMAEGLLTSANVKFVCIGNPTSRSSEFYQCFKSKAWAKVSLTCFDSPNFKANGIHNLKDLENEIRKYSVLPDDQGLKYLNDYKVKIPYLLTVKWAVENASKWGINHPLTVSKILGDFPEGGDNTLIPLGWVEDSQMRFETTISASDRKTIGVDVARFGSDSTVLTAMHGKKVIIRKEFFKHDALEVTGEVIQLSKEIGGADIIVVDETGVGGGVADLLLDATVTKDPITKKTPLPEDCEVRGVQFGASPNDAEGLEAEKDREKFVNIKARMYSLLADDIKSETGLFLINDSVYLEELPSILFRYDAKGKMAIESKDEYKKRTGRKSPDSADSLALANFGRYDELTVGKFTKNNKTETKKAKPRAAGLNSDKSW